MKAFLKENFVLIAGLALPLVLTAIFFAAAHMKAPLKNPPITPVIYAVNNYYENTYKFDVTEKGELELTYTPPNTARGEHCCPAMPGLYKYDPLQNKEDELKLPEFDLDKKFKGVIPDTGKLSDATISPDGWHFDYDYSYNEGNIMTFMFGGGSRYGSRNVLIKDHYRVPVSPRRYETGKFIAWVLPAETAQ